MQAHMTIGTLSFLLKLEDKHPDIPFYFMSNAQGGMSYYEDVKKNVFAAGKTFDIVHKTNTPMEKGQLILEHIPVPEESEPLFLTNMKLLQDKIHQFPGFQAYRLLKQKKSLTYVILSQWAKKEDYERWIKSDTYKHNHLDQIKYPAYFAERPFKTRYIMYYDED